jgi:hypothetical protein
VRLNGRLADEELLTDLGIREAADYQTKDFALALAELLELLWRGGTWHAGELLDHAARHRRREKRVAGRKPEKRSVWIVPPLCSCARTTAAGYQPPGSASISCNRGAIPVASPLRVATALQTSLTLLSILVFCGGPMRG